VQYPARSRSSTSICSCHALQLLLSIARTAATCCIPTSPHLLQQPQPSPAPKETQATCRPCHLLAQHVFNLIQFRMASGMRVTICCCCRLLYQKQTCAPWNWPLSDLGAQLHACSTLLRQRSRQVLRLAAFTHSLSVVLSINPRSSAHLQHAPSYHCTNAQQVQHDRYAQQVQENTQW